MFAITMLLVLTLRVPTLVFAKMDSQEMDSTVLVRLLLLVICNFPKVLSRFPNDF